MAQSQLAFIDYVMRPAFQLLEELIPGFVAAAAPHMDAAAGYWREQQRAEEDRRRQLAMTAVHRRLTSPVMVTGGVAAAAVVAGGVLGGLALSAQADFNASHEGSNRAAAYDRGGSLALGADIAFGTALVAGVVAVVLYFTQSPVADPAP